MRRTDRDDVLAALPASSGALVENLLRCADARALSVCLVGGPVRDHLLGLPIRDVDLVVEPQGQEGAPELARAAASETVRVVVHSRFGTATLRSQSGAVDLATARRESYPRPGALPTVEPGTLEDDLTRRDFTVNALAMPLSRMAMRMHPPVVDYGAGLADLDARRLRIFHPRSFHDDPTRALRAARLGPRLGFALSRSSRRALHAALRDGAFGRVTGERLRREIEKLFEDARLGLDPARALRWLADAHVLPVLEPGLGLPPEAVAPLRRLGRALRQPRWSCERARPWVPGLALWLSPLPAALRRRALRRFAIRGEVARRLAQHPSVRDRGLGALARAQRRGEIDRLLAEFDEEALLALEAWATPTLRRRIQRYAAHDRTRRTPITGTDLVRLGLEGPDVGRVLARVRAAYLDGWVKTREEALVMAEEVVRRLRRSEPTRP